jgi:hypothetical protein
VTEREINLAAERGTWLRYTGGAFRWRGVLVRAAGSAYRPRAGLSLDRRTDKPMRVAVMDAVGNYDDMPIADLRAATEEERRRVVAESMMFR